MPIGTGKIGLFGGKPTIAAGCETFNTCGTFTVPEGLEIVSVTGVGGAGNPGNPGNPGACANPTTFNCVSVTPGATYPVIANGPVTISWCPQ